MAIFTHRTTQPENDMNAAIIEAFQGPAVTFRINGGRIRRTDCFDVMYWRNRLPGCTIFINGNLCDYGAWAE